MDALALALVLFLEVGLKLIGVGFVVADAVKHSSFEGPPTEYRARIATEEEIAAAALELPELLRRAEEAVEGERNR